MHRRDAEAHDVCARHAAAQPGVWLARPLQEVRASRAPHALCRRVGLNCGRCPFCGMRESSCSSDFARPRAFDMAARSSGDVDCMAQCDGAG
eukprot:2712721-Prymnesium_polylepis.1